jgi:hypothetical protein
VIEASEFLQNIKIKGVFMEYWNVGMMMLHETFSFINFLVSRILPIKHCRSFPEPNIPMFHCSLAQTWYDRDKIL